MAESRPVRSRSSAAGPALVPLGHHQGKPPIPLVRPVIVIGSRSNARIHLVSSSVSKAHALLVRSNGRFYIRDLASRTKLFVNDEATREADLSDGDTLRIGSFQFRFQDPKAAPSVRPATAIDAKLEVTGSDFPVPIDERVLLIGRRASCDIPLLEDTVSTAHAVIFEIDGRRFIRDLGSRTGTFVNGVSTHQHQLAPGDRIRIGETEIRYIPNEVASAVLVEDDEPAIAPVELAEAPAAPAKPTELDIDALLGDADIEAQKAASSPVPLEPLANADIAVELPPLSAEPQEPAESSSVAEVTAEKTASEPAIELGAPSAAPAEPDEPTPELSRRGWRDSLSEDATEVPAVEEQAAAETTQDVLKFPDTNLAEPGSDETIDLNVDAGAPTAVLDHESLQADAVESIAPPYEPVDETPQDLGLRSEDLVDLIAPPPAAPKAPALDLSNLKLDEAEAPAMTPGEEATDSLPAVEPAPAAPAPSLDLSRDQTDESTELPAVEESPPAPVDESPRPLIASLTLPPAAPVEPPAVSESPAAEEPAAPARKTRTRRGRKRKSETADAVEMSPAVEPAPAAEAAPAPLADQPADEIVPATEPTAESALEPAIEELALEALSAPAETPDAAPTIEELTDTTFDRVVRDFAGNEVGEIVESPDAAQQAAVDGAPPVEAAAAVDQPEAPGEMSEDEPAAVEALEPPAEAASETPEAPAQQPPLSLMPWGANQDNFLGGVPLPLAPEALPLSQTPIPNESDEAIKDLMEELDSAAAAESAAPLDIAPPEDERASAPELPTPPPMPLIPALPPRPRKKGVFQSSRRRADETIPRYDPETAPVDSQTPLTTSFEGLAMSPVREMDVFSQMSPPAVDDETVSEESDGAALTPMDQVRADPSSDAPPITPRRPRGTLAGSFEASVGSREGGGTLVVEPAAEPADDLGRRQKVKPAIPGTVDGALVGERRPGVTYAAELTEAEVRAIRRRYLRRVYGLFATMVVLIALTALGIERYIGVNSTVEGTIRYANLDSLNQRDRMLRHSEQLRLLKDDATRRLARRKLNERSPEVSPGFLNDQFDYIRVLDKADFAENNSGALVLRVIGRDGRSDTARVMAIATALYDQNTSLIEEAVRKRRDYDEVRARIAKYERELAKQTEEIAQLKIIGEAVPTREQIKTLEDQVAQLEQAWNESVAAMKLAEAELQRMKSVPAGAPDGAAPATAPAAGDEDEKIKALQAQLDEMLEKVNASKAANSEQAAAARAALDATLDAFQKQIADAQGMMNASPEIAAYIESAQKLQESTRQLTEALIRRQEQQFGRLTELRERLNEKMEARRIELWQSDKQLQELTDQLAILTRKYNAAVGGGLEKESEDLKVEIELAKNMIKARQELLPGDSFYADAIQQLQVIIDSTRKNIEEDRAKTEQLLTQLQKSFTSNPTIEKLPEEQKQVAAALQAKLAEMNQARKNYNAAVDAGAAESDAQLKNQIATLQAGIEARRKELAEANMKSLQGQQEQQRLAAIEAQQGELTKLAAAEADARKAYFERHRALRDAEGKVAEARDTSDRLEAAIRQKDVVHRNLEENQRQLENKKREADMAIEPRKPTENDIIEHRGEDHRLMYTLASGGGILVLFSALILWTLHSASIAAPALSLHAADLRPLPENVAHAEPSSNGKPAGGGDEEHEPAVV